MYIFRADDTSVGDTLDFLLMLYQHSTPIRIGLLPIAADDDEAGSLLVQIFHHLVDDSNGVAALTRLAEV